MKYYKLFAHFARKHLFYLFISHFYNSFLLFLKKIKKENLSQKKKFLSHQITSSLFFIQNFLTIFVSFILSFFRFASLKATCIVSHECGGKQQGLETRISPQLSRKLLIRAVLSDCPFPSRKNRLSHIFPNRAPHVIKNRHLSLHTFQ